MTHRPNLFVAGYAMLAIVSAGAGMGPSPESFLRSFSLPAGNAVRTQEAV